MTSHFSINKEFLNEVKDAMRDIWGAPLFDKQYTDKKALQSHFLEWGDEICKHSSRDVLYAKKAIKKELIAGNTDVKYPSLPLMIQYMGASPDEPKPRVEARAPKPEDRAAAKKKVQEILRGLENG